MKNKKQRLKLYYKISKYKMKKQKARKRIREFRELRRECFISLRKKGTTGILYSYHNRFTYETMRQVIGYFILNGYESEKEDSGSGICYIFTF